MYKAPGTLTVWVSFCLPVTIFRTCFDKNSVWVDYNASASDFTSVLIIMLPGALNSLVLPVTICHFVLLCGVYYYGLFAKLCGRYCTNCFWENWINKNWISPTRLQNYKCLGWEGKYRHYSNKMVDLIYYCRCGLIYHSIGIMTVLFFPLKAFVDCLLSMWTHVCRWGSLQTILHSPGRSWKRYP